MPIFWKAPPNFLYRFSISFRFFSLNVREVYIKESAPDTKEVVILKEEVEESFKTKVKNILEKHTYSHNENLMELCQTADTIITNILEEEEVVEKIYDIKF